MTMLNKKIRSFTLAETILVCSIFVVFVLWIILWINRAFAYMNNTRVLVRATNFAREGVEMVYNLRDTNRRKCSGNRDATRLYRWWDYDYCSDTEDGNLLTEWLYTIKEWKTMGGDSYIYAEYLTGGSDDFYSLEWFFNESSQSEREDAKITFSWAYSYYSWGVIATWNLEDLLKWTGIEFYRILRVFGVYKKDTTDPQKWTTSYTNSDPKEMRFCVKVFYEFNGWHHASELCSIMTNFME